ncbi:hypothetical protein J2X36_000603 [Methylobacterium sp. BE186]|nr:hypothetical protein [Methylobacterium sp. BE186]MDR7035867.1 hypothetical protein [Methylobacterium sp. BE186]
MQSWPLIETPIPGPWRSRTVLTHDRTARTRGRTAPAGRPPAARAGGA